jgi:succinate dehydrogenase/fumarate reductase cytochrome b subunit
MTSRARLARLQAGSGLAFAIFLTLHLVTTAAGAGGSARYDGALATFRHIYRPLLAVEIVLIAIPALVHVACAIAQIADRRRRGIPPSGPLVHRLSGYVLLAAIGGHVFATRVMPAFGDGPADFSYLAYSLLNWPGFMRPYYVLLGVAGAVHLVIGTTIALRVLGFARPRSRVAYGAATIAAVVVTLGVAGIIGGAETAARDRFATFRALYERFMPFLPPRL